MKMSGKLVVATRERLLVLQPGDGAVLVHGWSW